MRTRRMLRVRLALALVGVTVGQVAVWASISKGVERLDVLIAVALLHLVPYPIYVLLTRTGVMSVLGGVALMVFPVIVYGDTYFGEPVGATFAFVTVPTVNLLIVLGVIIVDQLLMRRTTEPT